MAQMSLSGLTAFDGGSEEDSGDAIRTIAETPERGYIGIIYGLWFRV